LGEGPPGESFVRFRHPAARRSPVRPFPAYLTQPKEQGPADRSSFHPREGVFFASDAVRARAFVPIGLGSSLYATGEQAGSLLRNGTRKVCWTTDSFCYTDQTDSLYQSHPWVLSVRADGTACGILAETTSRCVIDLTYARAGGGILFEADARDLTVAIIERPSPREVVGALAELTGKMPMPPRWALGYHQCRWSYETAERVREIAAGFRERKIPCDVIWMDIDYMDGFRCFTFSEDRFPDPKALNDELHANGFHSVWMIDPGIKVDSDYNVYAQGRAGGHFIPRADGTEYHGKVWPGDCAFPDFTRERTRNWWAGLYKQYMATGIDGVWNDMNEPAIFNEPGKAMPKDCRHDPDRELLGQNATELSDRTHLRFRNIYGMQMVRASRDGIAAANPDKRPFVLTRSNFLGGHRYAATWTGDNVSEWRHLAWSIPMVLNLGLSGQPFSGPDIGGFAGNATGDLFARWMGIGALLPFARGHSIKESIDHEPWSFGPECERTCRLALERRMRLIPFLYTLFWKASRDGLPICRPVFFLDPKDRSLRTIDDQFLLGDDVLVRACVEPSNCRRGPLPRAAAGWQPFEPLGGATTDPQLPELYLRPGAILPLGPLVQHVGEKAAEVSTLVVCRDDAGNASGEVYDDAGEGHAHQQGEYRVVRWEALTGQPPVPKVVDGSWAMPGWTPEIVELRA
jgi:alpha-glucosidase